MKKIHVVAGVIHKRGEVLIAQRSEKMSSPMCWEFPGGKVEQGESEQEALKRELFEELDINIIVGDFLTRSRARHLHTEIEMSIYACTINKGTPKANEHAQLSWVSGEALGGYAWAPADIPIIAYVEEWLKGNRS